MSSLPKATHSLVQVFNEKLQEFTNEIESIHIVWLEEIQQEAKRMFSRYILLCLSGRDPLLSVFTVIFAIMWR